MWKISLMAIGIALIMCFVALSLFRHATSDAVVRHLSSDVTTETKRQVAGKVDFRLWAAAI